MAPQIGRVRQRGARARASAWRTAWPIAGYREAITYSFVDPTLQRLLFPGGAGSGARRIRSPPSCREMRVSLWPGLLQPAARNLRRQQTRVRLFEIGSKFELGEGALREIETLAGVAIGARWPEQWGSAPRAAWISTTSKRDLDAALCADGRGRPHSLRGRGTRHCLRPGTQRRASCAVRSPIGWLGELHPRIAQGARNVCADAVCLN